MERRSGYFLLKTSSINPFQGQYPTMAVTANRPPTIMDSGLQNPVRKRPKRIKAMPRTARRIPSSLPTFLVIAIYAP